MIAFTSTWTSLTKCTHNFLANTCHSNLFTEPLNIDVSVRVEDYVTYDLQLSDVWSVRGSTAVFKCIMNPYYVKDYIHVVGWSKGTKPIQAGAHGFTWI